MKVSITEAWGKVPEAEVSMADIVKAARLRERIIKVLRSHKTENKIYISDDDLEDVLALMIQLTTTVEERIELNEKGLEERVNTRVDILPAYDRIRIEDYV